MPVIYVSRKGTAAESIDADPAYRAVYEFRAEQRRRRARLFARVVLVGLVVAVVYALRVSPR